MNLHVFPTNKQRENNNYQLNSCGQTRTLNITFAGRPLYQELNQQSANANLTAEKLTEFQQETNDTCRTFIFNQFVSLSLNNNLC